MRKIKKQCPICGRVFYGREIARYCSCKCRKKAQRRMSQMNLDRYKSSVTRCIETPKVYRFVINNCDYCARIFGVPPCPAPYCNIYELPFYKLPKSFLEVLDRGKCDYYANKNENIEDNLDPISNLNHSIPAYFFNKQERVLYLFLTRDQLNWLSKIDRLEKKLEINSKKNLVFIKGGMSNDLGGETWLK
ncbi:MAG: hypothetical protein QXQ02_07250 [Halobacteria archaeon]